MNKARVSNARETYWIDNHPMLAGWMMGVLSVLMLPLILVLLADVGVI